MALLLEHLRKQAERYLGLRAVEAVITVPARFGRQQCEALAEACRAARLRVLAFVKAPTAAAMAFSLTNPGKGRPKMLVCDVGASFFNFCLLDLDYSRSGDDGCLRVTELACGTDFLDLDAGLLRFCTQDLWDRFGVDLAGRAAPLLRLRRACELAKRTLSQWSTARVEVDNLLEGLDYSAPVSRPHFEECCQKDIEPLMDSVDWCLEDIGLERDDVDVVLVGGSARVPQVRHHFRSFFHGRAPHEVLRPDHAGVLGAAVYVAALTGALADSTTIPKSLRHLIIDEVTPWSAIQDQKADRGGTPRCDTESGGMPDSDDDLLDSVPGNEVDGCHKPLGGRTFRSASGRPYR